MPYSIANRGLKPTATFRDRDAVNTITRKESVAWGQRWISLLFMRVFRYLDANGGLRSLRDRKLLWASPMGFNDPFELTPRVEPLSEQALLSEIGSEGRIKTYYESAGKQKGLSEDESRKEFLEEIRPQIMAAHDPEKTPCQLRFKWKEMMAKHNRILCCSHTAESILMWSHYAEKHRGLVLEIETSELFDEVEPFFHEVRYRSNAPVIPDLLPDGNLEALEKTFDVILATKALPWSYEEEIRLSLPPPDDSEIRCPILWPFQARSIKRVILGCYDHEKLHTHQAAPEILKASDYKDVLLQWAYLDPHEYRLRFADHPTK